MKNAKLIARRYAQALYEVSKKYHKVDLVYEEVQSIQRIIAGNYQFSKLIYNKFSPTKEMLVFLNSFIKEADYSDLTRNFLIVLKTRRRFFLLKLINNYLYDLVMRGKGVVPVNVTTAHAVDRKIEKEIKGQIAGLLKGKVDVSLQVNKRILGGLTIAYNSKILDLSLLAKVNKLEKVFVK
jgi:F-type H+-transporting ATPase subunit O